MDLIIRFLDWLKQHEHHFGFDNSRWIKAPTNGGHVTGFLIQFCCGLTCNCAIVMPRENLMELATPQFREEFLASLNNQGWELAN